MNLFGLRGSRQIPLLEENESNLPGKIISAPSGVHRSMHSGEIVYNRRSPEGVNLQAKVAELVDALDLGSCGATRESSSLSFRTRLQPPGFGGFFVNGLKY